MGEKSGVQWCHHSFSINWGCTEIPQVNGKFSACDFCYARTLSNRWGFKVWGKDAPRRAMSEHYWNEPFRWNRKAAKAGEHRRVFCGPMNDICEDRRDLDPYRERLIGIVEKTPWLIWLFLTKRPALYQKFFPWKKWPANVYAGTTTEHQYWFDHRMEHLAQVPADTRFISAEPLFEPINIEKYKSVLSWTITGSESGNQARITDWAWVRDLKDQCVEYGIPYFLKQMTLPDKTVLHTPELDGRQWLQFPRTSNIMS